MSAKINVPELRFGEFSGEWEEKTLGDIGKVTMCKRVMKDQTLPSGDIPFYKIGTFGKIADAFISQELYRKFKTKFSYPNKGDILIAASGATYGKTVVFDGFPSYFQDSNIVWIANDEKLVYNSFLNFIYKKIKWRIEESTIPRLYNGVISSTSLKIPTLNEQEKIAAFLGSVDAKIEQLDKKRELLEAYKKGAMQRIFSQTLRFKADDGSDFPEWVEKKLGEVCKLQGGYAFKSNLFKDKGIPIIRISNISNENNYIDETTFVYYDELSNDSNFCIKTGDLLLAMSGATTGKSSIYNLKNKAYLNQRVGLFKVNQNKLYYDFLVQFVFSKYFSKQLIEVLVAGAQPNVSSKDIESFTIHLPSLKEQTKIANFLSALDKKIELTDKELNATKEFKKALLQKMFA